MVQVLETVCRADKGVDVQEECTEADVAGGYPTLIHSPGATASNAISDQHFEK